MTTVPEGAGPEEVAALVESLTFPPSKARTLGVEWELGLVDPVSLDLVPRAKELLELTEESDTAEPRPSGDPSRRVVTKELLTNTVELMTGVCANAAEAAADLTDGLAHVRAAADTLGVDLYGGGSHPSARWEDQEVTDGRALRHPHRPDPVVGTADGDLRRARPRRGAVGGEGVAARQRAAHLPPAPHRAVGLLALLGRGGHGLREQPHDALPAAPDRRAALPVRDLVAVPAPTCATSSSRGSSATRASCAGTSGRRCGSAPSRSAPATGSTGSRTSRPSPPSSTASCATSRTGSTTAPPPPLPPWHVQENKWRAARYGLEAIIIKDVASREALVTDDLLEARRAPGSHGPAARLRDRARRRRGHGPRRRGLPADARGARRRPRR